ncbi:hypothetical protein [Actinoplanes sp. GCM10030250]|uniref:hypothetical protein n=1 Tax=Actinoplanes sp. GCM10030250 TaxID=3273376 RepID=UPI003607A050
MRRTALYLGGLLLATGASLAMAGPAAAADNCRRDCDRGDAVAVVRQVERPVVIFSEDDDCYYERGSGLRISSFEDDGYYVRGGGYRPYHRFGASSFGDFEDNNIISQSNNQSGFINTNLQLAGIFD